MSTASRALKTALFTLFVPAIITAGAPSLESQRHTVANHKLAQKGGPNQRKMEWHACAQRTQICEPDRQARSTKPLGLTAYWLICRCACSRGNEGAQRH